MLCVVGADTEFGGNGITLEQYAEAPHAVLSVAHGFRATVEMITDQALSDLGRQRSVRMSSQYITAIADAVSRTDLVTTMPDFMVPYFATHMPIVAHPVPLEIPDYALSVVWHPRNKGDAVLKWFRQKLREHMHGAFRRFEGTTVGGEPSS